MAEEAKKKDRGLWFREMKSELKKVVWPNKNTVMFSPSFHIPSPCC